MNFFPLADRKISYLTALRLYLNWVDSKRYYIKTMRVRARACLSVLKRIEVLYNRRFQELWDWVFLCGKCLQVVKDEYQDTYQYGGTWKSKKK